MAQAIIGGVAHWISPFRLRELRRAAPFIDRVSARAGGPATVEAASEAAYDMLCVLAVGIEGRDADQLAAEASLEELAALRTAFDQVMAEAGLKPRAEAGAPDLETNSLGERRPAPPADPPSRSASASTTSSPNSC